MKVLIADTMAKVAEEVFARHGIAVDVRAGLAPDELSKIIGDYDGVAVRSATKITAANLSAPGKLKVIGRAGIGVDTIDVPAATRAGVAVMNTPFGNSITTAEHTVALMMALARQIPQANASTHAGKWEKSAFMGVELYGKTLGVIGCGNIGGIVASRARGLQMNVVVYDPFLNDDRAAEMGVEKVDFGTLLARADFITLHTPLNNATRGMIGAGAFAKMKKGVRIINCARGGLVMEADLKAALDNGTVAGAALDVFEVEPAKENILFGHPKVICTPHLGASTAEAQENVAVQVAEQMADFLLKGVVANAVNMPAISAEDAPRLRPYLNLATQLGRMAGQMAAGPFEKISIDYQGQVATLNVKPLTASVLAACLACISDGVNVVNAGAVAKAKGIAVVEATSETCDAFSTSIRVRAAGADVTGTLFAGKDPRIVMIDGVRIEAAITPHMLFIRNRDKPGMIGALGTLLAEAGVNIADFRLGRVASGGQAVALVSIDQPIADDVFAKIKRIPQVESVIRLKF